MTDVKETAERISTDVIASAERIESAYRINLDEDELRQWAVNAVKVLRVLTAHALASRQSDAQEGGEVDRYLDEIIELNKTAEDENGHPWQNSDMIHQTVMLAKSALAALNPRKETVGVKVRNGDGVERSLAEWLKMFRNLTHNTGFLWMAADADKYLKRLSALDLSPAEAPEDESEYEHPYSDGDQSGTHSGSRHKDNWRKPAAPSNPVVSDEMVEQVFQAVAPHIAGTDWREVRDAITTALSVKPQSGSDKP